MKIVEPSVEMLWVTPDCESVIEGAGRTCYKSEGLITKESSERFIKSIISRGHESVLEHTSASFRIVTNRFTTHQIVRSRLFSYSMESQRYCNYSKDKFGNDVSFVKPLGISDIDDVPNNEPPSNKSSWRASCKYAEIQYFDMIKQGIKPELARSVLPSSAKTEIVMSGNFRNWRHFLKLRMDSHAQADIRMLANLIQEELCKQSNVIFSKEQLGV